MPAAVLPRCIVRFAAPLLACGALAGVGSALAAIPEWRLDPTHSRVVFDVDHAGFSYSLATLSAPTGRLRFHPDGWDGAEAVIELAVDRLDFGEAGWNRTMLGRRWFHADDFPTIRFRSTHVVPVNARHARVHGELTVRGTTAPVVLEVHRNGLRRHPLTLRRTVGFSATTTLDRRAFGLDGSPNLIGSTVRVRIEVEAVRTRRENDDADPQHD